MKDFCIGAGIGTLVVATVALAMPWVIKFFNFYYPWVMQ